MNEMEGKSKAVEKKNTSFARVIVQATATGLYNIATQLNRGFGEVSTYKKVLHLSASLWETSTKT